jgi:hypothetical protein
MSPLDRRRNERGREAFESLRENLVRRLNRVCGNLAREDFDRLTEKMARIQLKYECETAVPPA